MANGDTNVINIAGLEKHPVKAIIMALVVGFGSTWAFYRPALIEDLALDFVTTASAQSTHKDIQDQVVQGQEVMGLRIDRLEGKIDVNSYTVKSLQTEFRLTAAFQLEHSIKIDLENHESQSTEQRDSNWSSDVRKLRRRLTLATSYKDCILNESPNCELLQRQLYQ